MLNDKPTRLFGKVWCDGGAMDLQVSTPALLFPAISLLFLSFTNRFLHLAALIRKLHGDWLRDGDPVLLVQIHNLRSRLGLIRMMQLFGALSLFLCVTAMMTVLGGLQTFAVASFVTALVLMAASLACLVREVWISGGALRILLDEVENNGVLDNPAQTGTPVAVPKVSQQPGGPTEMPRG